MNMSEEIRKRPAPRRRTASAACSSSSEGGAPVSEAVGSTCGHSGCSHACNVRYVGPVSSIRDHHAMHAARGVGHIWAASIITGFAVVLTGVLAFQSVQAKAVPALSDMQRIMQRLDHMEQQLAELRSTCGGNDGVGASDASERGFVPGMPLMRGQEGVSTTLPLTSTTTPRMGRPEGGRMEGVRGSTATSSVGNR